MPGGKKKGGNGGNEEDFKFDFGGKGGISKEAQQALLPVLQKKLDTLVGESSGYLESLPQIVQNRITALKHLQKKHDDLEKKFKEERAALEKKYDDLKNPLFSRRSTIVQGTAEPTAEELVVEKKEGEEKKEEKKETKTDKKEDKDIKGIPEFWLQVFKHHEDFGNMVEPEDEDALKHLIDVRAVPMDVNDPLAPSFILEFHFSPNSYFEDSLLTKKYFLKDDEAYGDVLFDHVESTEIKWKSGKNLTVKKVTKKEGGGGRGGKGRRGGRGGGGGPARTVTVEEPCNSWFRFFSPVDEDAIEEEDELQDILESDYELGLIVKGNIIPNAVLWFTGEIPEMLGGDYDDEEGDDEEDGDDDGEDNGDDNGDDDDEDDDEEFDPKSVQQPANGQQPECKQQ